MSTDRFLLEKEDHTASLSQEPSLQATARLSAGIKHTV